MNKPRRTAGRLLAFGAALLIPIAGTLAQSAVPPDMLRKQEITETDRQTIKAFIAANKAGLSTNSPAEIKKSREALVAPLENPGGVSVPFRVAYANALIETGEINKIAANKDNDLAAANALRVAGQAATGNTLNIVLEGLKDSRPQVRYAATVAARAAFVAAKAAPALSADELSKVMRELAATAAKDAAKQPVDGALQAMIAARDTAVPGVRSLVITRLADAAGARASAVAASGDADGIPPLLRVAAAIRADVTDAANLPAETKTAAAAFAARTFNAVAGAWKSDEPSDAMVQATKAAAAILALLDPAGTQRFPIGEFVAPGKREQFDQELKKTLDVLKGAPYNLPAEALKP
ncbi:MAG: hypothetical protein QM783_05300 [Phycisphaerales bacterium]